MSKLKSYVLVLLAVIFFSGVQPAQNLERKDVAEKYKWNLSDLYPDESAWQKDKSDILRKLDEMVKYKGKLNESAQTLAAALDVYFDMIKQYYRYADYASRLSDEDLRISQNQSLTQQASHVGTEISEKTAFLSPEILKIARRE